MGTPCPPTCPAHWSWQQLGTAHQWPSQINLFWVWVPGIAALLVPLKPVSFSLSLPAPWHEGPLWGLLAPKDLLEEKRLVGGERLGGSSPSP